MSKKNSLEQKRLRKEERAKRKMYLEPNPSFWAYKQNKVKRGEKEIVYKKLVPRTPNPPAFANREYRAKMSGHHNIEGATV